MSHVRVLQSRWTSLLGLPRFAGLLASVGALALMQPAAATPVNIDFKIFADTTPATLGAASGQAGVWNRIDSITGSPSLVGLGGAALPGVSLSIVGSNGFSGRFNPAPADVGSLLNDGIRMDVSPMVFTLSGLSAGQYDLYTYALNSDALEDGAVVDVLGSADGAKSMGGLWGGSFVLGTNYVLHSLTLAAGDDLTIRVTARPNAGAARVAGLQIVDARNRVPEPGTALLVLLAAGAAVAVRRRR